MAASVKRHDEGKVLNEKIKDIAVAMLTTRDAESGKIHSRPMLTLSENDGSDLWFLTQASTHKVDESEQQEVNLSYADLQKNRYVSVSGIAHLVQDQKKVQKFWKPEHATWFPKGKDDPDLALLKFTAMSAEYWDGPGNTVLQIFQAATSYAVGHATLEKHEKLEVQPQEQSITQENKQSGARQPRA